ncbi:MAG: N-acetyltransferase [Alphaproteobacteria bacterium]|nr:MAG: N-acetyltransferase [Alphaproteobacteria bacterium]
MVSDVPPAAVGVDRWRLETVAGATAIEAAEWERLETHDNPFLDHGFLTALEDSGTVGGDTGWVPLFLLVRDALGRLVGAAPAWLKGHSFGEYVFDHHWAQAWERAGGRYYPKLLVAVPFTPVTGSRLLVARHLAAGSKVQVRRQLLEGLVGLAHEAGLSGVHIDFLPEDEAETGTTAGWLARIDQQFHWRNRGWEDFSDYLASLKSARRKQIRRERGRVREAGISCRMIPGDEATPTILDHVFACYLATAMRKWGQPYLNRESFSLIAERCRDRLRIGLAEDADGIPIAMALHLEGGGALHGRYWGTLAHHPFLHFELCYHQAIEYAIARRLERVEAGAQGPHKIARGYEPVMTRSLHRFTDPRLHRAIADYLRYERADVAEASKMLAAHLPFRKDRGGKTG